MHSLDDADLIVCWTHNWPECPLEVLELKSIDLRRKTRRNDERRSKPKTFETQRNGGSGEKIQDRETPENPDDVIEE